MRLPIVDVDLWRANLDPRIITQWQAYFVLVAREEEAAARRAKDERERGLPHGKRYLTADEMRAQAAAMGQR